MANRLAREEKLNEKRRLQRESPTNGDGESKNAQPVLGRGAMEVRRRQVPFPIPENVSLRDYFRDHPDERRAYRRETYQRLRDAELARAKKYKIRHPEKVKAAREKAKLLGKGRVASLKYMYGLSLDDFHRICARQDQRCPICKTAFGCKPRFKNGRSALQVDHCHRTGRIRGVLCHACNLLLGQCKESTAMLRAMIKYIEKEGVLDEAIYVNATVWQKRKCRLNSAARTPAPARHD